MRDYAFSMRRAGRRKVRAESLLPLNLRSTPPPLPASSIEYWISEKQCTPTAWVGQIGGRSLTGAGTPVVAADGSFFKGRVVAQTAITGNKAWSATFAALALAGTRPFFYCIARSRTLDATSRYIVASNGVNAIFARSTNVGRGLWNSAVSVNSAATGDSNPHTFATWLDGAFVHIRVDATDATQATAVTMAADLTTVQVGTESVSGVYADASVAFVLICASKPSAGEEAALAAWSLAQYGV